MMDVDYLGAAHDGPALMRAEIDDLLEANGLDALVHATASRSDMASLSGYPALLLLAGPNAGIPVGIAIQGVRFSEPKLLAVASAFELKTKATQMPALTPLSP